MADWYKSSLDSNNATTDTTSTRTRTSISVTGSTSQLSGSGGITIAGHGKNNKRNENETNTGNELSFTSRRSPLVCRQAAVASSQPLASAIGYDILRQGGCAADAAVAIAAALAVTEPCSTGLGGDMFALYYDASTREVTCLNGSGRSPAQLTLDLVRDKVVRAGSDSDTGSSSSTDVHGYDANGNTNDNKPSVVDSDSFRDSALSVTVPGAAAGWEDLWKRHGSGSRCEAFASQTSTTTTSTSIGTPPTTKTKTPTTTTTTPFFTMAQLLEPAAVLAEQGFPVAPLTSYHWTAGRSQLTKWFSATDCDPNGPQTTSNNSHYYLFNHPLLNSSGQAPSPGEIMTNRDLARVLRELGEYGAREGFYGGRAGRAIIQAVQRHGGCLTLEDLVSHQTDFVEPIAVDYRACKLWQAPPNGQGIAGLIALSGLGHLNDTVSPPLIQGATSTYHSMIEMMRLGFGDWRTHGADPSHMTTDCNWLLNPTRIHTRAEALFDPNRASIHGIPDASSCTVSFQVVDTMGNAISFVNSNFQGFGTGIVPNECGFTLQNRGFGFSLEPGHVNALGPSKRPCHTIIPGLLTHADTGELYATLSNMGGHMQPQGHLQLTVAMLDGQLDPQEAVDLPRFCIADGTMKGIVYLEDGINPNVVQELQRMGHIIKADIRGHERSIFGRAQIIKRDRTNGVLWAGSDGRSDGCAMGF